MYNVYNLVSLKRIHILIHCNLIEFSTVYWGDLQINNYI